MTITPDIPPLDPMRVQVRKHALLNEISTKPSRRWWRFAVPATALVAAIAVTLVLWTPTNPNAYASWTAEPRAPGAGAEAVIAECRESIEQHHERGRRDNAPDWPEAPTEVSVVDQRGSMTLVLFTGPQSQSECFHTPDTHSVSGSGRASGLEPLGEKLYLSYGSSMRSERDGSNPMSVLPARVSPEVGKVRVDTGDGLRVTATIGKGWMLAWWPSRAHATSVTLYDHDGRELGTQPAVVR
ncbi:hypothetical protein [Lentzea sp.]|uniref:hypothetical protein n=1 Tax=Lentzea sp. TaxID=56099 RepID=UPI002C4A0C25|nr:hypothetical protein [Lentzea sp.]HUQ55627.1 hypothetical protein [Lentzea sp.]